MKITRSPKKKEMKNVNEYIISFPDDIQKILIRIRKIILNQAPDTE